MTYPILVATIVVESYEDHGAQYTLVLPDGSKRVVGDAQDEYGAIASVIDNEDGEFTA